MRSDETRLAASTLSPLAGLLDLQRGVERVHAPKLIVDLALRSEQARAPAAGERVEPALVCNT
jgi:hypothetical protein